MNDRFEGAKRKSLPLLTHCGHVTPALQKKKTLAARRHLHLDAALRCSLYSFGDYEPMAVACDQTTTQQPSRRS